MVVWTFYPLKQLGSLWELSTGCMVPLCPHFWESKAGPSGPEARVLPGR